jgi:metal-responsive CopG/Arc/MetJ family transcriptional regulator
MRKFNFYIEDDLFKRLKELATESGINSVGALIRSVLIEYLSKKKK